MRYSILSINDHYPGRPRKVPELYAQVLEQCVLAESLGYEAFFLAEHHFHEYGAVPDPAVMLAHMAARTERIRLGTAISVLPFRDPLLVAETYAMVDILSGGRLSLGVGSGYLAHEFDGFRVHPDEKRERFDEALDLVRRALAGETITHNGRHHKVDGVTLNIRPVQRPTPPIYVAVLRAEAAYHVGRAGHRIFCVPYASVAGFADVRELLASFRRGREESGRPAGPDDAAFAFHTFVAESDGAARREAAEAFDLYVETRLYARRQRYGDIMESGLSLMGSPDTVARKLAVLRDWGLGHVMTLQNFGGLSPDAVARSMRRFAESAMPAFRKLTG